VELDFINDIGNVKDVEIHCFENIGNNKELRKFMLLRICL
jgi:hypothetical protein